MIPLSTVRIAPVPRFSGTFTAEGFERFKFKASLAPRKARPIANVRNKPMTMKKSRVLNFENAARGLFDIISFRILVLDRTSAMLISSPSAFLMNELSFLLPNRRRRAIIARQQQIPPTAGQV